MQKILITVSIIAAVIALSIVPANAKECGYDDVVINGTDFEKAQTCKAIESVFGYLETLGFKVENTALVANFPETVVTTYIDVENGKETSRVVSGNYRPDTGELNMTSLHTPREGRTPMLQPWSDDTAYSILQHEIAHYAVDRVVHPRVKKFMSRAWAECIAYEIQFTLMDKDLLARVDMAYADQKDAMLFPWGLNGFVYARNPDLFSYQCHRSFINYGDDNLLRDIINGTSKMPIIDPMETM